MSNEERLFVQQQLKRHGAYMVDLLVTDIKRKKLQDTKHLVSSISFYTTRNGNNYSLFLSFPTYGRLIEIQYFKTRIKRREMRNAGLRSDNIRRKKDTRFYAKNVYGSINTLLGRLSSEFTEQMIEQLKRTLEMSPSLLLKDGQSRKVTSEMLYGF